MTMTLDGTNGVTFNDTSLQGAAASPYGLKNRIINGAMVVDQRNAGAATANTIADFTLDRWNTNQSVTGKFTIQQNAAAVTPPTGFTNYLGITSSSSYALLSGSYYFIQQSIEGYNVSDLDFGKATAKTITISFWVRSSLTGTFGGALVNSASDRSYPFSYTISVANTWEQKSVTIAGDTSGTWLTTNGVGIRVDFSLGMGTTYSGTAGAWAAANYASATGATSVVSTNGATWYVTGVQLEQNTVATPFERRLYNTELANCQRYYFVAASGNSVAYATGSYQTTTYVEAMVNFPVQMRTTATSEVVTGTNYYGIYRLNTSDFFNSLLQEYSSIFGSTVYNNSEASGTAGNAGWMFTNNASAKIAFSAEL